MLSEHDQIPHFTVDRIDGRRISYGDIWQRQNLVLLTLPPEPSSGLEQYAVELGASVSRVAPADTVCVVTRDAIAGMPRPGVVIADRWGEIRVLASGAAAELPDIEDVEASLAHVRMACPECEGGVR